MKSPGGGVYISKKKGPYVEECAPVEMVDVMRKN